MKMVTLTELTKIINKELLKEINDENGNIVPNHSQEIYVIVGGFKTGSLIKGCTNNYPYFDVYRRGVSFAGGSDTWFDKAPSDATRFGRFFKGGVYYSWVTKKWAPWQSIEVGTSTSIGPDSWHGKIMPDGTSAGGGLSRNFSWGSRNKGITYDEACLEMSCSNPSVFFNKVETLNDGSKALHSTNFDVWVYNDFTYSVGGGNKSNRPLAKITQLEFKNLFPGVFGDSSNSNGNSQEEPESETSTSTSTYSRGSSQRTSTDQSTVSTDPNNLTLHQAYKDIAPFHGDKRGWRAAAREAGWSEEQIAAHLKLFNDAKNGKTSTTTKQTTTQQTTSQPVGTTNTQTTSQPVGTTNTQTTSQPVGTTNTQQSMPAAISNLNVGNYQLTAPVQKYIFDPITKTWKFNTQLNQNNVVGEAKLRRKIRDIIQESLREKIKTKRIIQEEDNSAVIGKINSMSLDELGALLGTTGEVKLRYGGWYNRIRTKIKHGKTVTINIDGETIPVTMEILTAMRTRINTLWPGRRSSKKSTETNTSTSTSGDERPSDSFSLFNQVTSSLFGGGGQGVANSNACKEVWLKTFNGIGYGTKHMCARGSYWMAKLLATGEAPRGAILRSSCGANAWDDAYRTVKLAGLGYREVVTQEGISGSDIIQKLDNNTIGYQPGDVVIYYSRKKHSVGHAQFCLGGQNGMPMFCCDNKDNYGGKKFVYHYRRKYPETWNLYVLRPTRIANNFTTV